MRAPVNVKYILKTLTMSCHKMYHSFSTLHFLLGLYCVMITVYFIVNHVTTDASPGYTVVYRTGVVCYLLQDQERERSKW